MIAILGTDWFTNRVDGQSECCFLKLGDHHTPFKEAQVSSPGGAAVVRMSLSHFGEILRRQLSPDSFDLCLGSLPLASSSPSGRIRIWLALTSS